MKTYFYRRTNQFVLDKAQLVPEAQRMEVMNGLYAAVYEEFFGASENPKYEKLTPLQKMQKLNEYAYNWLRERGLEND